MSIAEERRKQLRAQEEQQRKQREIEFIRTPNEWPKWPFLPMKRSRPEPGSWPEPGIHIEPKPGDKVKVFLVGIFQAADEKKPLNAYPHLEYVDVEAMVADGWRVD